MKALIERYRLIQRGLIALLALVSIWIWWKNGTLSWVFSNPQKIFTPIWIQTVSIVVLVVITWCYAKSTKQLAELPERQRQEAEKNRRRIIINSLLAEIKYNSDLATARNPLGSTLLTDTWQTYKGELDFLSEGLVSDIHSLYVLVSQANDWLSVLRIAYGWNRELLKTDITDYIDNLQTFRDKTYNHVREKAVGIIQQLESVQL